MKTNKISIIGVGNVGSATAYTLMINKVASEIVLVDVNLDKAKGEALDIFHGTSLVAPVDVYAGQIADTKGSDIVIIAAGVGQKEGESRLNLVERNVKLYQNIIPEIAKYNPQAILLVISNPVDILTYITYKISGFSKKKVIGSGTVLDTSRLRSLLAREFSVDARNVHSYVLGEHGDSEVIAWSKTVIGGLSFSEFIKHSKLEGKIQSIKDKIAYDTKCGAYDIIKKKGFTNYAIAVAVSRICTAILRDENSLLTVSSLLEGQYGIKDVYLSSLAKVGRSGISDVYELYLSEEELGELRASANILKSILNKTSLI